MYAETTAQTFFQDRTHSLSYTNPSMSGSKEIKLVAEGIRASFTTYGARLVSLQVPDRDSVWREVNIGYDDVETYVNEKAPSYFGAVIG